ncbi:MAG: hypothetical protein JRN22_01420, partial [Nitrososphaerota archaeon]|nr:hypothetical protein [Nitrososphaerota archaeon]
FKQTALKGLKYFVAYGIPFLIPLIPTDWMKLTIGTVIVMAYNALKQKMQIAGAKKAMAALKE